eukprot:210508-Chlamydomonas_euryale.AAC.1
MKGPYFQCEYTHRPTWGADLLGERRPHRCTVGSVRGRICLRGRPTRHGSVPRRAARAASASQLYEYRYRAATRVERQRTSRPGGPHGLS